MIYFKCMNMISFDLHILFRSGQFYVPDLKRKFRGDHAQRTYYFFKSLWSDHCEWFCPFRISHCEKQPRKSADMICMVMGKTNNINRFKCPSFFLDGDLRSLTTVDQQIAAVIAHQRCGKPSVWKWHHACCS